jgi:hypothetical protein
MRDKILTKKVQLNSLRHGVVLAVLLATIPTLVHGKPPGGGGGGSGGTPAAFSGRAVVADINLLGGSSEIVVSDTGPLPASGGALEASLLTVNANATVNLFHAVLQANVAHATAVAQGTESQSEASVANLDLSVAGIGISADLLMSRATAECVNGVASIAGSSELVNLRVAGLAISVSGAPNQTVEINTGVLNVEVIINEQSGSASGGSGEITVNALHVYIDSILTGPVAEVIISSAHADIACGKPVCFGGDFVTGGGWITATGGARGNFGVAGGIRNKGLWGHLNYIDHGNGMHVKATGITGYTVVNTTTRRITGTAEINGQSGHTFVVIVSDNGEPGVNDTFSINLSNGYAAAGMLGGGNIQLHKPKSCR